MHAVEILFLEQEKLGFIMIALSFLYLNRQNSVLYVIEKVNFYEKNSVVTKCLRSSKIELTANSFSPSVALKSRTFVQSQLQLITVTIIILRNRDRFLIHEF